MDTQQTYDLTVERSRTFFEGHGLHVEDYRHGDEASLAVRNGAAVSRRFEPDTPGTGQKHDPVKELNVDLETPGGCCSLYINPPQGLAQLSAQLRSLIVNGYASTSIHLLPFLSFENEAICDLRTLKLTLHGHAGCNQAIYEQEDMGPFLGWFTGLVKSKLSLVQERLGTQEGAVDAIETSFYYGLYSQSSCRMEIRWCDGAEWILLYEGEQATVVRDMVCAESLAKSREVAATAATEASWFIWLNGVSPMPRPVFCNSDPQWMEAIGCLLNGGDPRTKTGEREGAALINWGDFDVFVNALLGMDEAQVLAMAQLGHAPLPTYAEIAHEVIAELFGDRRGVELHPCQDFGGSVCIYNDEDTLAWTSLDDLVNYLSEGARSNWIRMIEFDQVAMRGFCSSGFRPPEGAPKKLEMSDLRHLRAIDCGPLFVHFLPSLYFNVANLLTLDLSLYGHSGCASESSHEGEKPLKPFFAWYNQLVSSRSRMASQPGRSISIAETIFRAAPTASRLDPDIHGGGIEINWEDGAHWTLWFLCQWAEPVRDIVMGPFKDIRVRAKLGGAVRPWSVHYVPNRAAPVPISLYCGDGLRGRDAIDHLLEGEDPADYIEWADQHYALSEPVARALPTFTVEPPAGIRKRRNARRGAYE
ncbi:hypothetical protein PENSPDRAFT_753291 [Peniophora sp. CONT]|nr:hypothetical protein PENSPDRAFT_753291 [Peniophora sp. CONT]